MRSKLARLNTPTGLLLAGAFAFSGCEFGVQGGAAALSSKFTGISAVSAVSPTSAQVSWKPQNGYASYTVYSSSSDQPLVTLKSGTSFIANGLNPNTSYSFSVVGTAPDGSQYGSAKHMQATTWSNFLGPASASAADAQSVTLNWSYNIGPSFQIYYAAGAAPTITTGVPATLLPAQFVTSSPSGYTVGGLSANTTYSFMAIAKYSDGTDSFQNAQSASTPLTAQYLMSGGLGVLPTITTASSVLATTPPIFNVTKSMGTYTTTLKLVNSDGATTTTIGSIVGNGTVVSNQTFAAGIKTVIITTRENFSGLTATSEFSAINVAIALPNNGLRVVTATTPSSLSPLPVISTNPISLGPFPAFNVAGAQPSYTTTIYTGAYPSGSPIGSIIGSGQIKTATSSPLPQGPNTLYAVVTANGQTATINNIQVQIKSIDSKIVIPPAIVNGGIGTQGFGRTLAVGDYNCDGRPDLAVSAPNGNGVYVYYGSASGLDFSAAPDPAPLAGTTKPLFIAGPTNWVGFPTMSQSAPYLTGSNFGVTMASGNFNGDFNITVNKPCSDLAIATSSGQNTGADGGIISVYYGSPTGIQTGPAQENALTCVGGGSSSCTPVFYKYWTSGVPNPSVVPFIQYYYEGMGYAMAVGDLDGDGYDDIVASTPFADPVTMYGLNGFMALWRGSANGLSPAYTKIYPPANLLGASVQHYFGMQLAIGHFVTSPRGTFPPGPGNLPPGPADLAISFVSLDAAAPGVTAPTTQSGVIVVPGKAASPYVSVDPVTFKINSYFKIVPPHCNTGNPGALPPTWNVASSKCASSPNTMIAMDVNRDGQDDLVFSDLTVLTPAGTYGAVYVYYGNSIAADFITQGAQSTFPSPGAFCPDPGTGKCITPQVFYRSDAGLNYFGSSLANLGDVNSDGYPDLGIGGSQASNGAVAKAGVAYIYRGSANGVTATSSVKINPSKSKYSYFGTSMAGAKFSSVTGFADSYINPSPAALTPTFNDVAVGAIGESPANRVPAQGIASATGTGPLGSQAQGTVSLFLNAAGLGTSVTSAATILAPANVKPDRLGSDEASLAGDINGDGFSDVVIRVKVPGPMNFTQVYGPAYSVASVAQNGFVVYYGSPTGFITTQVVGGITTIIPPSYSPLRATDPLFVSNSQISGTGFNDAAFAYEVGPAGDMNGDGFADVFTANYVGYNSVLFYGSSSGLIVSPTPRKIAYGSGTRPSLDPTILVSNYYLLPSNQHYYDATWGLSITHGDFNGDGISDLVFFGYYNDATIIYGSSWGPVTDGDLWDNARYPVAYAAAAITNQVNTTANCVNQPFGPTGPAQVCYPLVITVIGDAGAPLAVAGNPGASRVISGGDLDGDGTDDLVSINVRDATWNKGAGTISIYYGGKTQGIDPHIFVNLRIAEGTLTPIGPDPSSRNLGGPAANVYYVYSGGAGKAYDINGDGLGDLVFSSHEERAIYVVYGVPGPGSAPTVNSGAYIQQGYCASYPCYLNITNVGAPDYAPNHVMNATVGNPNSCSPALRSCNVMRFKYPYDPSYSSQIFGVGDITGDAFGEVVQSRTGDVVDGRSYFGSFVIYSGSASGLQVVGTATANPNCMKGICDPTFLAVPSNLAEMAPGSSNEMYWYSTDQQNPQDVDGDGKRDFLISSQYLNALDPAGNVIGTNTGGFFLFH